MPPEIGAARPEDGPELRQRGRPGRRGPEEAQPETEAAIRQAGSRDAGAGGEKPERLGGLGRGSGPGADRSDISINFV
jgi:hypothetical protein